MGNAVLVEEVISNIENLYNGKNINGKDFHGVLKSYLDNSIEYRMSNADRLINYVRNLDWHNGKIYYYMMSFLLHATLNKEIHKELIRHCINDTILTKENKFFIYNQLKSINFLEKDLVDEEISDLTYELYNQIYEDYLDEVGGGYNFIPKEERTTDLVLVIGTQMIGMGHGPTKTLCDRCYVIEEFLKKKVFIINTAELLSPYMSVPFFDTKLSNYIEDNASIESIDYLEKRFSYLQCPREMPQVSVIKEILEVIQSEKPYFILTVGESLVGDLCSRMVPVIEMATVHSERILTKAQFQVIGRNINNDDRRWLQKHNMPEAHIIESLFTFAFKPQTHQYTRKDLNLPEKRFIVLVVGARLDDEINEEFLNLLHRLTQKGIFIAFMGVFENYELFMNKYEMLKCNSCFLGFRDDVLAVNECCDLYLNPERVGGGTSCAEALYKGLPVVTFAYGDVGLGAGIDFHVSDYEDMYKKIIRYSHDEQFYRMMSEKAIERGRKLTDSKTEFVKTIRAIEKNNRF